MEAVNLGFATDCNTSGYKLYIEGTGKILISNQVRFDENLYPYRNTKMVSQHLNDIMVVDVMSLDTENYEWIHFTPEIDLGDLKRYILDDRVILTSCARLWTQGFIWELGRRNSSNPYLTSARMSHLTSARAFMATKDQARVEPYGNRFTGLPGNIDPTKPPKNFRDAMSREDRQEWAEEYDAEH